MKKITVFFIAYNILFIWCLGSSTPAFPKDPPFASSYDKNTGITTTSTGGNTDGGHTVTQTDASGNPVGQPPADTQAPPPTEGWTDDFEEWGDDDLDSAEDGAGGASTPDSGPDTGPSTPPPPPTDGGDDGAPDWTDDFEEWGDDDPEPETEEPSYEDQVQDRIDRNREWNLRLWGMRDEVRRAREKNKQRGEKKKPGTCK